MLQFYQTISKKIRILRSSATNPKTFVQSVDKEVKASSKKAAVVVFKCPTEGCGRAYRNTCDLISHLQSECQVTASFKCPNANCGRAYKYEYNLKKHLSNECGTNLNELFKCPNVNCGRAYKYEDGYDIHLHERDTSYAWFECPHCSYVTAKLKDEHGQFKKMDKTSKANVAGDPCSDESIEEILGLT